MVSRRPRRRSVAAALAITTAAGLLGLALPSASRAAEMNKDERARLAAGEVIRRPIDLDLPSGSYFGGVAYAVIRAPPEAVMAALLDPSAYHAILPLVVESKVVGAQGKDKLVFFRHGTKVASAAYTAIVRRESPGLLRFWLDPTKPKDIEDCWGYFRVQPFGPGESLLTYGALLRLEFGLVKLLFSEKIRKYALDTPILVRRWVEGRGR